MGITRKKNYWGIGIAFLVFSQIAILLIFMNSGFRHIRLETEEIQKHVLSIGDTFRNLGDEIHQLADVQNRFDESLSSFRRENEASFHSVVNDLDAARRDVARVSTDLVLLKEHSLKNEVYEPAAEMAAGLQEQSLLVLEKNPRNVKALVTLGELLFESGDLVSASKYLEQVVELEPFNGDAFQLLARVCRREGEYDKSAYLYSRLTKLEPENPSYHYYLAESLMETGRYDEAIPVIGNALSIDDSSPEYLNLAGRIYGGAGRIDEALPFLSRSLVLKSDPEIYALAGDFCGLLDRIGESADYREKAIATSDLHTEAGVRFVLGQYALLVRSAVERESFSGIDEYFRRSEEFGGDEEIFYLYLQSLGKRTLAGRFARELRVFESRYPDSIYAARLNVLKSQIKET